MKKTNILCANFDSAGVGYWRILQPHLNLQKNYPDLFNVEFEKDIKITDLEKLKKYDIIVIHRGFNEDYSTHNFIFSFLKSMNIKVVLDIDDDWEIPTTHPLHFISKHFNLAEHIKNNIKNADYVTTTTEYFASVIKPLNKNVKVLYNSIDTSEKQFSETTKTSDRIRIGWLGGSSHEHDFALLNDTFNKLSTKHNNLQFVLCGFDIRGVKQMLDPKTNQIKQEPIKPEETAWYRYEKIMTSNYNIVDQNYKNFLHAFSEKEYPNQDSLPYKRNWTKPVKKYAEMYEDIDILLAPLIENRFNKVKSNLKVIEAGFMNKVFIGSDIEPYRMDIIDGYNGFLIDNKKSHKEWFKRINQLISDKDLMKRMAENLNKTVKDKYNMDNVNKTRKDFYLEILK